MPYAVGAVTRWILTWDDTRFQGLFKNILHFRGVEASVTGTQLLAYINASGGFHTYLGRWLANICYETSLRHIEVANLTDLSEPTIERRFGQHEWNGAIGTNDDDVPQAAACITRKTFLRGRKAIGHVYFGPLPSIFTSEGMVVPDPTGTGDLQDVLDCLGDPLLDGVTGWSARPIVCNAAGTGVVANNDVRVQSIAPKTVYLRSRRPGVGE